MGFAAMPDTLAHCCNRPLDIECLVKEQMVYWACTTLHEVACRCPIPV